MQCIVIPSNARNLLFLVGEETVDSSLRSEGQKRKSHKKADARFGIRL